MKTGIHRLFILTCIVLLVVGCNPVYKKNTIVIPPKSEAGLLCVKSCNSDQQLCNSQCLDRYEQCKAGLSSEIKSIFDHKTDIYYSELEQYNHHIPQYNRSYNKYLAEKTKYQNQLNITKANCDERHDLICDATKATEQTLEDLKNNFYSEDGPLAVKPIKPSKPVFAEVANEYVSKRCSKSCNCNSTFQACFAYCGGSIKLEKICVRHCK